MCSHRIQAFPPDCQNKVLLITLKQNFKSCEDRGVHDSLPWKRKLNLQFRELKKMGEKKRKNNLGLTFHCKMTIPNWKKSYEPSDTFLNILILV